MPLRILPLSGMAWKRQSPQKYFQPDPSKSRNQAMRSPLKSKWLSFVLVMTLLLLFALYYLIPNQAPNQALNRSIDGWSRPTVSQVGPLSAISCADPHWCVVNRPGYSVDFLTGEKGWNHDERTSQEEGGSAAAISGRVARTSRQNGARFEGR